MKSLSFEVLGDPAPQGSKTAGRSSNGRIILRESSAKVKPWRQDVVTAAREAIERAGDDFVPFDGPTMLEVNFFHARRQSHYGTGKNSGVLRSMWTSVWKKSSPDLSKMIRSTEDALTTAGVWKDDRLVAMIVARDMWSHKHSGASITVSALEG